MEETASTPATAIILWIAGAVTGALGLVLFLMVFIEPRSKFTDLAEPASMMGSGLFLFAVGSVIDKLARIEHHLRPIKTSTTTAAG